MGKQTSYFRGCKCRVIYITFYGIKAYKCLNNDCDNSECLLVLLTYKSIYCLIYIVYKLIFMLLIPKMNRGMICEKSTIAIDAAVTGCNHVRMWSGKNDRERIRCYIVFWK